MWCDWPVPLTISSPGTHVLEILSVSLGLFKEVDNTTYAKKGIVGDVFLDNQNITKNGWLHRIGLNGQTLKESDIFANNHKFHSIFVLLTLLIGSFRFIQMKVLSEFLGHEIYNKVFIDHCNGIRPTFRYQENLLFFQQTMQNTVQF